MIPITVPYHMNATSDSFSQKQVIVQCERQRCGIYYSAQLKPIACMRARARVKKRKEGMLTGRNRARAHFGETARRSLLPLFDIQGVKTLRTQAKDKKRELYLWESSAQSIDFEQLFYTFSYLKTFTACILQPNDQVNHQNV